MERKAFECSAENEKCIVCKHRVRKRKQSASHLTTIKHFLAFSRCMQMQNVMAAPHAQPVEEEEVQIIEVDDEDEVQIIEVEEQEREVQVHAPVERNAAVRDVGPLHGAGSDPPNPSNPFILHRPSQPQFNRTTGSARMPASQNPQWGSSIPFRKPSQASMFRKQFSQGIGFPNGTPPIQNRPLRNEVTPQLGQISISKPEIRIPPAPIEYVRKQYAEMKRRIRKLRDEEYREEQKRRAQNATNGGDNRRPTMRAEDQRDHSPNAEIRGLTRNDVVEFENGRSSADRMPAAEEEALVGRMRKVREGIKERNRKAEERRKQQDANSFGNRGSENGGSVQLRGESSSALVAQIDFEPDVMGGPGFDSGRSRAADRLEESSNGVARNDQTSQEAVERRRRRENTRNRFRTRTDAEVEVIIVDDSD